MTLHTLYKKYISLEDQKQEIRGEVLTAFKKEVQKLANSNKCEINLYWSDCYGGYEFAYNTKPSKPAVMVKVMEKYETLRSMGVANTRNFLFKPE